MKLTFTSSSAQISYLQKIAIVIIFAFSTSAMFAQGNSGNSNGNGPNLPTKGLANLPFWGLSGNPGSTATIIGTTANFPFNVVVNNIQRASFTNSGMELTGTFHSTFASIDSIINCWKIIADALETKTINAEQYFQNDTLVDLVGLQLAVGIIQSAVGSQQLAIDTLQNEMLSVQSSIANMQVENTSQDSSLDALNDTVSILTSQISNLIGTVDTVVLNNVQVNNIIAQSISSDTIYLTGPILADTVKIPNELKLGDQSLYISGLKTGDPTSANRIYSREDDLLFQSIAGNNFNTIINSGNTGNVGIGTISPAEKLTVDGNVSVSGSISANTFNADKFSTDTLRVTRILPSAGDSLIHFGENSILMNHGWNSIYGSSQNSAYFGTISGIGIGGFAIPKAVGSLAVGFATMAESGATNSVTIGSGIVTGTFGSLTVDWLKNNIPNSLMVGFNSDIPTLTVRESSGIGTAGKVGIGTSDPKAILDIKRPQTTITDIQQNINANAIALSSNHSSGAHLPGLIWYTSQNTTTPKAGIWASIDPGEKGSYLHFATSNAYNQGMNQIGMTMDYNGNVGIGTTGPGDKFIVYQPTNAGTAGKRALVAGDTLAKSFFVVPNATGNTANGTVWNTIIKDEDVALIFRNAINNTGGAGLVIAPNYFGNPTGIRMDAGGNVGIGISTPRSTLNIYNDGSASVADMTGGVTKAGILISSNVTGADKYLPGVFWSFSNLNPTLPIAGMWVNQKSTGASLYFGTSDNYASGITNANNAAMVINQKGNVGIGTTDPQKKLEINAGSDGANGIRINSYVPTLYFKNQGYSDGHDWHISVAEVNSNATLAFKDETQGYRMVIDGSGNVGIGITNPDAKLEVNGDVKFHGRMHSRSIRVNTSWSDYVFDPLHLRLSFEEKEHFYQTNKHLPNIPSAKEIETDGLDVGDVMKGMMQNIEEDRLDITELNKRLVKLEKENENLKKEIILLKSQK